MFCSFAVDVCFAVNRLRQVRRIRPMTLKLKGLRCGRASTASQTTLAQIHRDRLFTLIGADRAVWIQSSTDRFSVGVSANFVIYVIGVDTVDYQARARSSTGRFRDDLDAYMAPHGRFSDDTSADVVEH